MRHVLMALLLNFLACGGWAFAGDPPAVQPALPAAPKVSITVDCAAAPQLKEWGDRAKAICEEWWPRICEKLRSDGFTPRESVSIVFKQEMKAPAATGGGTISVNAPYVDKHRDDLGMMVHELTHAVQAYPRNKANMGWLVEGIADYIRFWKYEPQVKQRPIDPKRDSYKDGYRTTAAFLAFLVEKHDPEIVRKLNAKLRQGECDEDSFKELLGKSPQELWEEFVSPIQKAEGKAGLTPEAQLAELAAAYRKCPTNDGGAAKRDICIKAIDLGLIRVTAKVDVVATLCGADFTRDYHTDSDGVAYGIVDFVPMLTSPAKPGEPPSAPGRVGWYMVVHHRGGQIESYTFSNTHK